MESLEFSPSCESMPAVRHDEQPQEPVDHRHLEGRGSCIEPVCISTVAPAQHPYSDDFGSIFSRSSRDDALEDRDQQCLICLESFSGKRQGHRLPCGNHRGDTLVHYRCIAAWFSSSSTCPLCRMPADISKLRPHQKLDLRDALQFVSQPIPIDAGIVRCLVAQSKRGLLRQAVYTVYIQPHRAGLSRSPRDRLVMSARKLLRSPIGSEYLISVRQHGAEEKVGRVCSNFLGTQFVCYEEILVDDRSRKRSSTNAPYPSQYRRQAEMMSISKQVSNVSSSAIVRRESACVTYAANRTSVGPRKMQVCIPSVPEDANTENAYSAKSSTKFTDRSWQDGRNPDLSVFCSRPPVYREDLGAYCLDFGGRVSLPSVKNFQLISSEDSFMGNLLQFGRVDHDLFTMDFQWPLSPLQAFSICLSSCDTKLACV